MIALELEHAFAAEVSAFNIFVANELDGVTSHDGKLLRSISDTGQTVVTKAHIVVGLVGSDKEATSVPVLSFIEVNKLVDLSRGCRGDLDIVFLKLFRKIGEEASHLNGMDCHNILVGLIEADFAEDLVITIPGSHLAAHENTSTPVPEVVLSLETAATIIRVVSSDLLEFCFIVLLEAATFIRLFIILIDVDILAFLLICGTFIAAFEAAFAIRLFILAIIFVDVDVIFFSLILLTFMVALEAAAFIIIFDAIAITITMITPLSFSILVSPETATLSFVSSA